MATSRYCLHPDQCYAFHGLNENMTEMNKTLNSVMGMLTVFFESWKLSQKEEQNFSSTAQERNACQNDNPAPSTVVENCLESLEKLVKREDADELHLEHSRPKESSQILEEESTGNDANFPPLSSDSNSRFSAEAMAGIEVSSKTNSDIVDFDAFAHEERVERQQAESLTMHQELVEPDFDGGESSWLANQPYVSGIETITDKHYSRYSCVHPYRLKHGEKGDDFGNAKEFEVITHRGKSRLLFPSRRYPGTVLEFFHVKSNLSKGGGTVVYYRCNGCRRVKEQQGPSNSNPVPYVTVRNGRIVTDPDFPKNDHFCQPRAKTDEMGRTRRNRKVYHQDTKTSHSGLKYV